MYNGVSRHKKARSSVFVLTFRVKDLVAGRNGARGGGAGPWFRRSRCGFARIPLRFDAPAVVSREFRPLLAFCGGAT